MYNTRMYTQISNWAHRPVVTMLGETLDNVFGWGRGGYFHSLQVYGFFHIFKEIEYNLWTKYWEILKKSVLLRGGKYSDDRQA